jgi:hypothetical protein
VDRRERQTGAERCLHDRYPVVVEPVEGGRVARCLGCGRLGPVRPSSAGALAALRNEPQRSFKATG